MPVPVPPVMRMLSRPFDAGAQQIGHLGGERLEPDEVVDLVGVLGELADGEGGAVHRQRRDDRVDPGAVGETGVHHGRGLVDATAHLAHDPLDHPAEVLLGEEAGIGPVEPSLPLDVDGVVGVDHDLGDGIVEQELLDRPVPEHVVAHLGHHAVALAGGHGDPLGLHHPAQFLEHQAAQLLLGERGVVEARSQPGEEGLLRPVLQPGERVGNGLERFARHRLLGDLGLRSLGCGDVGQPQALVQFHRVFLQGNLGRAVGGEKMSTMSSRPLATDDRASVSSSGVPRL